jgi:hypothetical protein
MISKKKIQKLKVIAFTDDETHDLLKWYKKVYNKELFHKKKRKEYCNTMHQIESKLLSKLYSNEKT